MTLSPRLEMALGKLYNAFHNDQLHPEYCTKCAVGNICDNLEFWHNFTDGHGSTKLNYIGLVNQNFGKRFYGYTPLELLQIETAFLRGCGYELPINRKNAKPKNPKDKGVLFNGLCETVAFLCRLDQVPNVMEFQRLFEVENDQPKYRLQEVLS